MVSAKVKWKASTVNNEDIPCGEIAKVGAAPHITGSVAAGGELELALFPSSEIWWILPGFSAETVYSEPDAVIHQSMDLQLSADKPVTGTEEFCRVFPT